MSKRYFYARVSTKDQNLARQLAEAKRLGIPDENIFCDKASGKDFDREDYNRLLEVLKEGDLVYFDELNRLGRDYDQIISNWKKISREIGCDIVVLDKEDLFDTRKFKAMGEYGKLMEDQMLSLMSYVADQERKDTLRRQADGIAAMPVDEKGRKISTKPGKEGRTYGRKEKRPENFEAVYARQKAGELKLKEALAEVGIGRTRWYELAAEVMA